MLAHIVYFELNDPSEAQIASLIEGCQTYLTDHAGCTFFAVGRRSPGYNRPVNQDFHVALHVIFDSLESHDAYQVAPRHLEFVDRFKASWKSVRVFDADC